jgi:hypothetical protein
VEIEEEIMKSAKLLTIPMVVLLAMTAWWARGMAFCFTMPNGTRICTLDTIDPPGTPDTLHLYIVRFVRPEVGGSVEFRVGRVRSCAVDMKVYAGARAPTSWVQALALVPSEGADARLPDTLHDGAYSPLSTTITKTTPAGARTPAFTVSAAMPRGATQAVRLAVARQGTVVWQAEAHPTSTVATVSQWPSSVSTEIYPAGGLTYSWKFGHAGAIRVKGSSSRDSTVTGDEVRITGPQSPTVLLSQTEIKTMGVDSLKVAIARIVSGAAATAK